jgi:DNA-3-methyladenine glycosylase
MGAPHDTIFDELKKGALHAAPLLLGCKLTHRTTEGVTSGYIVEVEVYTSQDAASHTYNGQTARNAAMFMGAGTVYVYFTYGMHYCFNVVAGTIGSGQGLLIRALEPIDGIDLMRSRRGHISDLNLTNGPAKLVQAMGITKDLNQQSLHASNLDLAAGFTPEKIVQTTRIGIKKSVDAPWRFYVAGNPYVSKM